MRLRWELIPALYFTDAVGGRDRESRKLARDFGVHVGMPVFAHQQAMLACHLS